MALTVSFEIGYLFGSWLNETFCLSDMISDVLIDLTQLDPGTEYALDQFVENREKRGLGVGLSDIADFTNRCAGGGLTPFCAGFVER
jgi:hypothetical protein